MDFSLPAPLLEAYRSKKLALCIGSGLSLSAGVQGHFPSWKDLPFRFIDACSRYGVADDRFIQSQHGLFDSSLSLEDMLAALGVLRSKLGRDFYQRALNDIFRPRDASPGAVHRIIAQLGVRAMLTTNYDGLIEEVSETPRRSVFTWMESAQALHDLKEERSMLLKIHGTAERADTVVLTELEYHRARADRSYQMVLSYLFQGYTFLFLGYGMNDPLDIDRVLKWNADCFGPASPRHYALMKQPSDKEPRAQEWDRFLREYNVQVLGFCQYGDLQLILEQLPRLAAPNTQPLEKGRFAQEKRALDQIAEALRLEDERKAAATRAAWSHPERWRRETRPRVEAAFIEVLEEYRSKGLLKTYVPCQFDEFVQFYIDQYVVFEETKNNEGAAVWGVRCAPDDKNTQMLFESWTFVPGKEVKKRLSIQLPYDDVDSIKAQVVLVLKRIVGAEHLPTSTPELSLPAQAPTAMSLPRDQVFISYSHKDSKWLERLETHLKPRIRNGKLDIWNDKRIKPGAEWRKEIDQALARAKVAVLLVSPHFLASDFIVENELPSLLEVAEKEGVKILWVPLSHAAFAETKIDKYQAVLDPARPMNMRHHAHVGKAMEEVCKAISQAFSAPSDSRGEPSPPH